MKNYYEDAYWHMVICISIVLSMMFSDCCVEADYLKARVFFVGFLFLISLYWLARKIIDYFWWYWIARKITNYFRWRF